MIGEVFTQLTPFLPPFGDIGATYTGSGSFAVAAGETYGFYVNTTDGFSGRGDIAIGLSGVPLPASAPMFGAALMALGAVGYSMKRKAKAV